MTIQEVFEKYKHMDEALSDTRFEGSYQAQMFHEFWQAIKEKATERRVVMCVYCGVGIPYSVENGLVKADVFAAMKAHDSQCEENPLVQEIKRLTAGEDAAPAILRTLELTKKDFDWHRANTGLDPAPQSEEMGLMEKLLEDLRAGRIVCRRTP